MTLKEIMTSQVSTVEAGLSVREAALEMANTDVGTLPVVDGKEIVGILTDRDITVRAVAPGLDPDQTPVRDVMTPQIVCCLEDDSVEDAAALMRQNQVRRLVVLDGQGRLAGIVSLADLARRHGDDDMVAGVLHDVTEPTAGSGHTLDGRAEGRSLAPRGEEQTRRRTHDHDHA